MLNQRLAGALVEIGKEAIGKSVNGMKIQNYIYEKETPHIAWEISQSNKYNAPLRVLNSLILRDTFDHPMRVWCQI